MKKLLITIMILCFFLTACDDEDRIWRERVVIEGDKIVQEYMPSLEKKVSDTFGDEALISNIDMYYQEGGGELLDGGAYSIKLTDYIKCNLKINNSDFNVLYNYKTDQIFSTYYTQLICDELQDRCKNAGIQTKKVEVDFHSPNTMWAARYDMLSSNFVDAKQYLREISEAYPTSFAVVVYVERDIPDSVDIPKLLENIVDYENMTTSAWFMNCDYEKAVEKGMESPINVLRFPLVSEWRDALKNGGSTDEVIANNWSLKEYISSIDVYENFDNYEIFDNYIVKLDEKG